MAKTVDLILWRKGNPDEVCFERKGWQEKSQRPVKDSQLMIEKSWKNDLKPSQIEDEGP